MPCPTCDHMMQNIGAEGQRIFWCNRCGTLKSVASETHEDIDVPIWVKQFCVFEHNPADEDEHGLCRHEIKRLQAANAMLGKSLACAIAIIKNESGGGTPLEKSEVLKRWARELIEEAGWTEEDYYAHL